MNTHHVGITVADLDASVAFWETVLETAPVQRARLDGAHLGDMLGYPGLVLDRALFELPDGPLLELLRYVGRDDAPYDPATAHPGNVHVCLMVDDIEAFWERAVGAGAVPASEAPVTAATGATPGLKLAMLRSPDGVSIELLQPPAQ